MGKRATVGFIIGVVVAVVVALWIVYVSPSLPFIVLVIVGYGCGAFFGALGRYIGGIFDEDEGWDR